MANTHVGICGDDFTINGRPTYEGRVWEGYRVEGLLMNSRMVQGTFDDENPDTRHLWAYPDTGEYDADRNTSEFIDAMPTWLAHGLTGFTVNLQGGGHIYKKPWPYGEYINSAYAPDGTLKPAYMDRVARIIEAADDLGMIPILSLSYFGIDHRTIDGPDAVRAMTDGVVDWLAEKAYRNVIIEITNERMGIMTKTGDTCAIELINRMRARWDAVHAGRLEGPNTRPQVEVSGPKLLLTTSQGGGGALAKPELVEVSDYIILHGNGQSPERHVEMIQATRETVAQVHGKTDAIPIVFNEAGPWWEVDEMDKWVEASDECVRRHVSWGYFTQGTGEIADGRRADEPYVSGYQTPPVNWGINTDEKKRWFGRLKEITGA